MHSAWNGCRSNTGIFFLAMMVTALARRDEDPPHVGPIDGQEYAEMWSSTFREDAFANQPGATERSVRTHPKRAGKSRDADPFPP